MQSRLFKAIRKPAMVLATAALAVCQFTADSSADDRPAKQVFSAIALPEQGTPQSIGYYANGCLAGAVALPTDGPGWQVMRLSRNRRWGHPELVSWIEQYAGDVARNDGWPGILVGDMSQPRGGPMASGHASHQVGLDVDIWLQPMPNHRMSADEREKLSAQSLLKKNARLTVDPAKWNDSYADMIVRAANYPEVQRVFVNPSIKKKLCETWTGSRANFGKLRPYYGHDDHIHVRLFCRPGSPDCKKQAAVPADDGCGKELAWWYSDEPWAPPKKPTKPTKPAPKPHVKTLADLPKACTAVVNGPSVASVEAATYRSGSAGASPATAFAPVEPNAAGAFDVPVPLPRPPGQ
ncbi:penicillin-insensitive murein endopeptidase [Rhizobium sp. PAMB 3182]